jgi:uncharacterized integral membrane protein (TIGR02327 family)
MSILDITYKLSNLHETLESLRLIVFLNLHVIVQNDHVTLKSDNLLVKIHRIWRLIISMDLYNSLGVQAGISIFSHIFFISISFYALQALRLEQLFKKGRTFQIQLIYILVSITIGSSVSNFILDITSWSKQLPYIFS